MPVGKKLSHCMKLWAVEGSETNAKYSRRDRICVAIMFVLEISWKMDTIEEISPERWIFSRKFLLKNGYILRKSPDKKAFWFRLRHGWSWPRSVPEDRTSDPGSSWYGLSAILDTLHIGNPGNETSARNFQTFARSPRSTVWFKSRYEWLKKTTWVKIAIKIIANGGNSHDLVRKSTSWWSS